MKNYKSNNMLDFPIEIKSVSSDGSFRGYASVFGVVDNQMDVIVSGAFRNTIAEQKDKIKLLWQHDMTQPIGHFNVIREDELGLYVEGQLLLDVQKAKEAHALLKARAINGLSIGYNVKEFRFDAESGVRIIHELDLFEISLVTFPANELANVAQVKAVDDVVCKGYEAIELSDAIDKAIFRLNELC